VADFPDQPLVHHSQPPVPTILPTLSLLRCASCVDELATQPLLPKLLPLACSFPRSGRFPALPLIHHPQAPVPTLLHAPSLRCNFCVELARQPLRLLKLLPLACKFPFKPTFPALALVHYSQPLFLRFFLLCASPAVLPVLMNSYLNLFFPTFLLLHVNSLLWSIYPLPLAHHPQPLDTKLLPTLSLFRCGSCVDELVPQPILLPKLLPPSLLALLALFHVNLLLLSIFGSCSSSSLPSSHPHKYYLQTTTSNQQPTDNLTSSFFLPPLPLLPGLHSCTFFFYFSKHLSATRLR
jgi:hypothetical protein